MIDEFVLEHPTSSSRSTRWWLPVSIKWWIADRWRHYAGWVHRLSDPFTTMGFWSNMDIDLGPGEF